MADEAIKVHVPLVGILPERFTVATRPERVTEETE
jgi:hypothetical protein